MQYSVTIPEYQQTFIEDANDSTLYAISFASKDQQIDALLRIPRTNGSEANRGDADGKKEGNNLPGIVLLPGATVTKEREQGLARYLSSIGFASITFDQRNLGGTDQQGDWQMFLRSDEPTEHKMVYDALAAAEVLRSQPKVDPNRIIYVGESNGGRFAIIACALDTRAKGVVAISTSGYGTDKAARSGRLTDPKMIRFLRSIDPETYLGKITPRQFVMIHSRNDTVISFAYAEDTYAKALMPKSFHAVGCAKHGYCTEMNADLEEELNKMAS